jgi:hypothetical protein
MRVLEQWRSVGTPGRYEVTVAMSRDELPEEGQEVAIPELGGGEATMIELLVGSSPELRRGEVKVRFYFQLSDPPAASGTSSG